MKALSSHSRYQFGRKTMTKQTILMIDDDETLLELLSDHLKTMGYNALTANSGKQGLELVTQEKPDLVVLDVMMPQMDGWEVCKQLRESSRVPIIMLTAKGEEIDKLRGFNLGVDDYVTKPFSFAELVARAGAVLARTSGELDSEQIIASGDIIIDLEFRNVTVDGKVLDLTPTEYRLLATLASYAKRTVPTERLLTEVWGQEYEGETDHVKHYIWSLRKKLEIDPGAPKHILTERGFGYRFE
jgi:two-component system KDP operon response regulator KdpE